MRIIRKMRQQKAVWWQRLAVDQYGRFAYATPVEIDCRWDATSEEFRDTEGQKQLSNAVVYPDRVMSIGDMLQEGQLDSNDPDDPRDAPDAHEIRRFDKIPDLKATETLFRAYL